MAERRLARPAFVTRSIHAKNSTRSDIRGRDDVSRMDTTSVPGAPDCRRMLHGFSGTPLVVEIGCAFTGGETTQHPGVVDEAGARQWIRVYRRSV